jgi:cytochrome c peroxidase
MRLKVTTSILAFGSLLTACDAPNDTFTDHEWSLIQKLEPLKGEMPRNPYNLRDQNEEVAKLGQMLFFDKEVAEAITVAGPSGAVGDLKKVGCVNCHDTPYFTDSHVTSPGALASNGLVPGLSHGRSYLGTNTGQLTNSGWYAWTLWAGRFDSMVEHGAGVWGTSATPVSAARFLYAKYKDEWNAVFTDNQLDPRLGLPTTDPANVYPLTGTPAGVGAAPGAFEMLPQDAQDHINLIKANLGRAFDSYPRMLTTPDSPFQRYVRDRDYSALSGAQKRGLKLFIGKAACADCHNGPIFSDNKFHNIGAPNVTQLPGSASSSAPNRGRAVSVGTIVTNMNAIDANANIPIVFNGASKYSDDPVEGYKRLDGVRKLDEAHCLCRKTDAIATTAACTPAVMSSPTQMALLSDENIPCVVTDEATGKCTCRQTDAITDITKCTDVVIKSNVQVDLRAETKVTCLKYDDTIEGMFRTPSLLNIGETAPYFHSGAVQTLEDVIWFYNEGGGTQGFVGTKSPEIKPLHLTEDEMRDLAEFLRSLTGKSPSQQAAEKKKAAMDNGEDPNAIWDWSKNTAKPPLTGAGGAPATGAGGGSGAKGGSSGGAAGSTGTAGTSSPPPPVGGAGGMGGSAAPAGGSGGGA